MAKRIAVYRVLIYAGRGPGGLGSGAKTWGIYSTKAEAQQQKYNARMQGYKGIKIVPVRGNPTIPYAVIDTHTGSIVQKFSVRKDAEGEARYKNKRSPGRYMAVVVGVRGVDYDKRRNPSHRATKKKLRRFVRPKEKLYGYKQHVKALVAARRKANPLPVGRLIKVRIRKNRDGSVDVFK